MKNVQNTTATATATTATAKGLAYVLAHKADLVGDLEKTTRDLVRKYTHEEREHTQFNGRRATLLKAVKSNPTIHQLVSSAEFTAAQRAHLTHICLAETDGNGNVIGQPKRILVKMRPRTDKTVEIDAKLCKEFMPSIKADEKHLALLSYTYEGETRVVTNFADLSFTKDVEVADEIETEINGEKKLVHVYDECDGKRVLRTKVVKTEFYPVLSEVVSPRDFARSLEGALADMWLRIFPETESETESK